MSERKPFEECNPNLHVILTKLHFQPIFCPSDLEWEWSIFMWMLEETGFVSQAEPSELHPVHSPRMPAACSVGSSSLEAFPSSSGALVGSLGKPALGTLPLSALVFSTLCVQSASTLSAALLSYLFPHLGLAPCLSLWLCFHFTIGNFCLLSAMVGKGEETAVTCWPVDSPAVCEPTWMKLMLSILIANLTLWDLVAMATLQFNTVIL